MSNVYVANMFIFDPTSYNLQEGCGFFNVTVKRTGTSALPIEMVLSTPNMSNASSNYIPSWNFYINFEPTQLTATAVVPIIDDSVPEKTDDVFPLTLSIGPISESLSSGVLFGEGQSSSTLAYVKVVDNDNGKAIVTILQSLAENSIQSTLLYWIFKHIFKNLKEVQ